MDYSSAGRDAGRSVGRTKHEMWVPWTGVVAVDIEKCVYWDKMCSYDLQALLMT